MASKKAKKGDELQQKSPAEFFAENKNIAGFDNPGKCLYTTIRELVENALDSAESIGILPVVEITVEEVSTSRLNAIRGVEHHDRLDPELYQDYESEGAKKKRLAKETKEQERLDKVAATKGQAAATAEAKRVADGREGKRGPGARGTLYYRVTVRDNGSGMPHKDIPNMLGRVLSGTKYGVKQTRGKFGLGAKMALIWSKMTTGLPFEITSALVGQQFRSHYVLDLNIHRNEPQVLQEEQLPNPEGWHGASLGVTIEGSWPTYRSKVVRYLRALAVITPYAQFVFRYKAEEERNSVELVFRRRTDIMPPAPTATKHHPSSVDLELVKRLLTSTKTPTLTAFLTKEFDAVSRDTAGRLVEEMRLEASTRPGELTQQQVVRLHQLLKAARFPDPSGAHLSPAGEYNLRLGVLKELRPELVATHQGDVRVFEGHAFVVEAAVSVGGRDMKPGINVHRFANRIPLLFEGGSDVITKTALKRINWGAYKIQHHSDKVGVFVSIVSTKIPFKGAGKEYIGDDVEEMVAGVKSALQACCLQLKAKIVRRQAARDQKQRKRNLTKYIPSACNAIWGVLEGLAHPQPATPSGGGGAGGGEGVRPAGPKRRRLQEREDLLPRIARGELTVAALTAKLEEHVERIDTDLALEYHMQQGLQAGAAKEHLWLMPASERHTYGPELQSNTCRVRLITAFR